MSDDTVKELTRIASQIVAMRTNAPKGFVDLQKSEEFNNLVARAAIVRTENLDEFLFRKSDVRDPSTQGRIGGMPFILGDTYSQRIDAFLNYLRGTLPPDTVSKIGFPTP